MLKMRAVINPKKLYFFFLFSTLRLTLYYSTFMYSLISAGTQFTEWWQVPCECSSHRMAANHTLHTQGHTNMALLSSASNTLLLLFSLIMIKVQHDYLFPRIYILFTFTFIDWKYFFSIHTS